MADNVVRLQTQMPCLDIVTSMRDTADRIEAGEFGVPMNAMFVLEVRVGDEQPNLEVFGWGKEAVRHYALGMLHAAAHFIIA